MPKKHLSTSLNKLLKQLHDSGYTFKSNNAGTIKVLAPDGISMYTCHKSEKAFHPLRRWASKYGQPNEQ